VLRGLKRQRDKVMKRSGVFTRNLGGIKGGSEDGSDGDSHENVLCTRITPNPRHIRSLAAQAGNMSIFWNLKLLLCSS
jgi:hypothetical protein